MNNIPQQQNTEASQRILKARQRVYAVASRLQKLQFGLTVCIPIAGASIGLWRAETRPYVAMVMLLITVLDSLFIDRLQRAKIRLSAKIAERFDCDLFKLPWNKIIAGKEATPEEIDSAATAWRTRNGETLNWYPPAIGSAPLQLARILCQRASLSYDAGLRRHFTHNVTLGGVLLFTSIIIVGVVADLKLVDFVLTILAPAAPILIWSIREANRQSDAADATEALRSEIDSSLESLRSGACSALELDARSREIQNGLYVRRVSNPLQFPFVYRIFRSRMEAQMNSVTAELLNGLTLQAKVDK